MLKKPLKKVVSAACALNLIFGFAYAEIDLSETDNLAADEKLNISENPEIFSGMETADFSSEPQKLLYGEYIFSEAYDNDKSSGILNFFPSNGGENVLSPCEPSPETKNCSYKSSVNNDRGSNWTVFGNPETGCAFSTRFLRPNGSASSGFLYFKLDETKVSPSDKNFIITVEYFGNTDSKFALRYITDNNKSSSSIEFKRTNSNAWETAVFNVTGAYFNGTGSTGLADGKCDFRIEAYGVDTYIKSVKITNSESFEELKNAADSLELNVSDTGNINESFALPQIQGCDIIWNSNSDAVVISDGIAKIFPDVVPVNTVLTAKIIKDGYYLEKEFDITLAAKEKTAGEISAPILSENGNLKTVSYDINNGDSFVGKVILVAYAKDKTSGMIKRSVSDTYSPSDGSFKTLSAGLEVSPGEEFAYYIINSKGALLTNCAPMVPSGFRLSFGIDSIRLLWNAADDDYNFIKNYIITESGSELGRISGLTEEGAEDKEFEYVLKDLTPGQKLSLSLKAEDHMGLLSDECSKETGFPDPAVSYPAENGTSKGMTFKKNDNIDGGDSYTEEAEANGEKCRKTVNRKPINGKHQTYMYFVVDRDYVATENKNVIVEVRYLDKGTGGLYITYTPSDNGEGSAVIVDKMTDTGKWKTASVTLNNAMFCQSGSLTSSDIRIGGDDEVYISRVRALSPDKY